MEKKEREELKKRYLKFAEDDRCIAFIPDGDGDENNLYLDDIFEDVEEELLDFISLELYKAREEVERKFVEKYHKRGKEMNVPYSEEDGKEFWQGYKEGYNQGLKDMIVDTYYLDKEFELKLKQ